MIYFWLCWVFVAEHWLALAVASGGCPLLQCTGFSCFQAEVLGHAGISGCGTQALLAGCTQNLPRAGIEPALAGGSLTTRIYFLLGISLGPLSPPVLPCSIVSHSATPWTVAHQAPMSLGFPRQESWSGLPFPPPGDLPDPGDSTHVSRISCIGRWILNHCTTSGDLSPSKLSKVFFFFQSQPFWSVHGRWKFSSCISFLRLP